MKSAPDGLNQIIDFATKLQLANCSQTDRDGESLGDRKPQCIFCSAANTKSGNFAYKDSTILTNHRFPGCRIYQNIYERVKTVMTQYNQIICILIMFLQI